MAIDGAKSFASFPSPPLVKSEAKFAVARTNESEISLTSRFRNVEKRHEGIAFGHQTVHDVARHSLIAIFRVHTQYNVSLENDTDGGFTGATPILR